MKQLNHNSNSLSGALQISNEEYESLINEIRNEVSDFDRFDKLSKVIENFPAWLNEGSEDKILIRYGILLRALAASR